MRQDDTTNETSVMISLRELVTLEDERVREEELEREQAREREEQARQAALLAAAEAEEARRQAEEERRAVVARQQAEHAAKLEAMHQAEVERARIEARANAAQAAVEAQQIHERELALHDNERKKARMKMLGLAALFAAMLGGSALGYQALQPSGPTHDGRIAQLEAERAQLLRDRLVALDRFRDRLAGSLGELEGPPSEVIEAKAKAEAARGTIDDEGLADARLARYDDALSRYAERLNLAHREARLVALHAVHDKLAKRVERMRRPKANVKDAAQQSDARRAAVDAADPANRDLEAYDRALEKLALILADAPAVAGLGKPSTTAIPEVEPEDVCDYNDPLCARFDR